MSKAYKIDTNRHVGELRYLNYIQKTSYNIIL